MSYTTIDLKPLQMVAEHRISELCARRLGVEPRIDMLRHVTDDLVMRLSTYVWAVDPPLREFDFQWPATWWQGFKEACYRRKRVCPQWWIKRWPVRWERRAFTVEELYPEFRAKIAERCVIAVHEQPVGAEVFEG